MKYKRAAGDVFILLGVACLVCSAYLHGGQPLALLTGGGLSLTLGIMAHK